MINKKRVFGAGITAVIFLLIIMVLTTPSKSELDQRALKESGIVCENMDQNERCRKDNQAISSSSSHLKNIGIFTSYEKDFALENGERITVRMLGVFGNIFKMKDGKLWEILN